MFFDAFISYGRSDSKDFAIKLHKRLTSQGLKIWFDQNDIPLGVDFQNQINKGIENAHNFIFIIAPHSLKSPYCYKEIVQAIKYNKRIIPLLHVMPQTQEDWDKMHPTISQINWIYFQGGIDDFEASFTGLVNLIHKQTDYVKQHTQFLVKALEWEKNHKQNDYLLIGPERLEAELWLKIRFKDEQPPCEPTDLQCEFIVESTKNANNLMTQVFISYSEQDKEVWDKLSKTLRRSGFTIWTNKTDIKTGTEFQEEINKGIEGTDNVVYLLSPASLQSKYCQQELTHAFANNKRIISLLIEFTELSQIPSKIRALQFINFTEHEDAEKYRNSTNKFLKELRQEAYYYEQHKVLLVKALKWLRQNRNRSILLRGHNLQQAEAWLQAAKLRPEHPPLPLQVEFITGSTNQSPELSLEVFVSYSRADSDFARKLNEALQLQGKTTWFDQESIALGSDFQQEIYRGIESSDNFLFIISPNSVHSPYCADEVEYAQQLNKRLVTVLHRYVPPQDLHPGLRCIQWIDFNRHGGDFYANFSELVRTLDTDREHVHSHTKWFQRALEWEQNGKSADLLLRGSEFSIAQNWLQEAEQNHKQPPATLLQKEFIEESQNAIVAAKAAEKRRQVQILRLQEERTKEVEARLVEQKKSARRQKFFLAAVSVALVVSIVLGAAAFFEYQKAALSELKAIITSSEALFVSNKRLDALREAIRAKRQLQNLGEVNASTQAQVESVLRQAVYGENEYNRLSGHSDGVRGVAFSPDGRRIATTSADKTAKLWKIDGTLLFSLPHLTSGKGYAEGQPPRGKERYSLEERSAKANEGHSDTVWGVAFSPDGRRIATTSADKTVKLWKIDGTLLKTLYGHSSRVIGVAFSPDGRMIASTSADKTVKLWRRDGTLLFTLYGHSGGVCAVSFSPDSKIIASASKDGTVKLWKIDGTLLFTLKGHNATVWGVAFSPDGRMIASTSADKTIKLWRRDGTLLKTLYGHGDEVKGIAFSPDGNTIASTSDDKSVKIWRRDGTLLTTLKGHDFAVYKVAFSPDGNTIASASDDNSVKLWKISGTLLTILKGHNTAVLGVAFNADSNIIASASTDKTVKLWSRDGMLLNTLKGHNAGVMGVAFSPDGNIIASASQDKTVKLWSHKGTLLKTLKDHSNWVYAVSFSPDGNIIASASQDETVKLWNRDGMLLNTLKGHSAGVTGVAFSPDGNIIASASQDKTVKLWSRDGTLLNTLKGHSAGVIGVVFSPDGNIIASASQDKTVKLWSRDGTLLKPLTGHSNGVYGVAFSSDGRLIASVSADKTVKIWRRDGTLLKTLYWHSDDVWGIAFSPNGKMIASASWDNTVILWDLARVLDLDQVLVSGCDWVRDYLKHNSEVEQSDRHLCDSIGTRQ